MGKYYNTCRNCGANLDPCERCDCNNDCYIGIDLAKGDSMTVTKTNDEIQEWIKEQILKEMNEALKDFKKCE